ncbi:phage tail protein [Sphingobium fuliginis]|uniref:Tip attachment protein J domain-containing protein n=1 Tax=Sphingobium fuliginis ATCC 27551 TaxID=1208342 RepID=A0A5B8CJZ2_SPHSA|nr:phage tail protein [Sphingobium fuliginis]QDC37111.1 hypothetical protein FIL70_07620 [Sphingobium fuliginis ATCC 27551]
MPDGLAQKLGRANGASCPGYRGIASIFFTGTSGLTSLIGGILTKTVANTRGFYWTANTPYLPGVWAKVQRIFKRADGTDQWYPEKAAIPNPGSVSVETLLDADTAIPANNSSLDGLSGGITFTLAAGESLKIVKTAGLTYGAWSFTPFDGYSGFTNSWRADFSLRDAEGNITNHWGAPAGPFYLNDAAATAYMLAQPAVIVTGSSAYTIFLNDATVNDNRGGLSVAVYKLSASVMDMNPAHIIRECLTDTVWGMGTPASAIDDAAFAAAADTLFAENFGLSLLWVRQSKIEDFVQEILDHIQGVLYVDPSTGLLTLSLVRGDYDAGTLEELTPDNCDLTNFSRKLWGDIVNEIIVTWTNPENEQEETITVQDDASIATQGGVVSDSRNYYGVRNPQLAMDLAMRDLRSAGQPLASCTAEVSREFWSKRPASVIKLTWPEYGISELVMRVQSVEYGKPGDPTIKLDLMEDVYGLDIGEYSAPPSTSWEEISSEPEEASEIEIFTAPFFFAANSTVAAFVDSPEYPEVLAGVLATSDNNDIFEAELWDEVTLSNGTTEWQATATLNIIGRGTLVNDLALEASSTAVLFENLIGQTVPTNSGFVIIGEAGETGNEIAQITLADGDYDIARGVLDTVPRAWPAGTKCWFVDESTLFEDGLIRSSGETVDYKVLTRTSVNLLTLEAATLQSYTLTDRPWLPNRPANVVAYGEAFSEAALPIDATARVDPWITVSWANRNRLDEDTVILGWTDATMTPETGQTTAIEVRDLDGNLVTTHDGLTGTSFDVPDASFGIEEIVELRVFSERTDADGDFVSLQYFSHWVMVGGGVRITEALDQRITEGGDVRITED